jgi:hypothetical protein
MTYSFVSCMNVGAASGIVGAAASDALCSNISRPVDYVACATAKCDFCSEEKCAGHGNCSKGKCDCEAGYTGAYCQSKTTCAGLSLGDNCCASATFDNAGRCCPSKVRSADGLCCSAPSVVDACGVCGGSGKVIT